VKGAVVLFQHRVAAPVHDRVEVQVEDGLVGCGEPGGDHLLVEGGEEPLLMVVGQPVGVAGQRGFLRQHGQPGEQAAAGSASRSSTWETRRVRVRVSLSASSDSSQEVAGMTRVPG
jgi:hypothetical protein